MAEYEVLRRIVIEEVTDQLHRPLTGDEAMALHAGIDRAVRRSVGAFVDHLAKQLKATDDLQSHYISFLNHDLRGGMNGILLMVEVLKRELAPDPRFGETMEDLDAMRRAVLDSVSTMDRFVFAHRLSRGKHQTKYQPFKIKPILNELVSHLAHAGRDRQVEFDVQVDDSLAASSDRDLVRLILQNLLLNTIKHAKRGGGRVRVTGEQRGTTAVLTVTDQGPGISAEQLPSIFTLSLEDPSQGKKAVKLGLPVAKQAADLIGATLKVQSSAEAGSTFTLEIPERRG
jgi:signal transduction histidine kinase